jgi:hypothetical protein
MSRWLLVPSGSPGAETLEQLSDVLLKVSATPDPAGFFRQAMRQWRRSWVERGGPEDQEALDWG